MLLTAAPREQCYVRHPVWSRWILIRRPIRSGGEMSHNRVQRSPSPSRVGFPIVDRRTVLKGLLGAAGFAAVPGLAACGSDEDEGSGSGDSGKATGTVTFGSNASDAIPKQALAQILG